MSRSALTGAVCIGAKGRHFALVGRRLSLIGCSAARGSSRAGSGEMISLISCLSNRELRLASRETLIYSAFSSSCLPPSPASTFPLPHKMPALTLNTTTPTTSTTNTAGVGPTAAAATPPNDRARTNSDSRSPRSSSPVQPPYSPITPTLGPARLPQTSNSSQNSNLPALKMVTSSSRYESIHIPNPTRSQPRSRLRSAYLSTPTRMRWP